MINVEASILSGQYGTSDEIGDILNVCLSVNNTNNNTNNINNKEVIFLLDISASMENSLKNLKSSLLAFRDSIVGKSPYEMENIDANERDQLLRNTINTRLITFSNNIKEIWSNKSNETFEHAVLSIRTEAMTNMGDALKLAFEKINKSKYTWLIVMTDGESNEGPCRTAESFQRLVVMKKPLNCKIIGLGYGKRIDPEVLNVIGTFVYVEDVEMISVVLGNLAEEIIRAIGFNCVIDMSDYINRAELTDDTVIIPSDNKINGKILAGSRIIEAICYDKTYHYICLSHQNNNEVEISYTDISTGEIINLSSIITPTNNNNKIDEKIREQIFGHQKRKLINKLYQSLYSNRNKIKIRELIQYYIEKWKDEDAADIHRQELIQVLNKSSHINNILNNSVNSGYNTDNTTSRTYTDYYLVSPLINRY